MGSDPASAPRGPIAALIAWCAANAGLTVLVAAALVALGIHAARRVPLDALPDLSDAQVIVFAEWKGRSPTLVEDQVTYPIVSRLVSTPQVEAVRGQSAFGLSFITVVFEDGVDPYWARSRVLEQLASVANLPEGVAPTLGPDASGVGWVFEYALVDRTGRHDLAQLRALQDFHLKYALASVPGVAEVATVGGAQRQYQVLLDPARMEAYGVGALEVADAVRAANGDAGGRVLEIAGHEHVVRGRGYVRSKEDLELAPVKAVPGGEAIRVRDVATVAFGPELGRGIAELDGEGACVGGIVVMRWGGDAPAVIAAVKERLAQARASLPEGVEVVTTYDRSELIRGAVGTLERALLEEMLIVGLVIAAFLLHARSALVAAITLPAAVALAFLPLAAQGMTANIMSLGGIAVAIGAMVDAAIVMVENAHRRLGELPGAGPAERRAAIVRALQEVGPSLFFALLVITVSFIPVFTLQGTEGRLFRPLAWTKTWSMAAAALLAVTLLPALAVLALRAAVARRNPIEAALVRAYAPVARACARHPALVVAGAVLALASTIFPWSRLQSEFMPDLDEGSLLYMPTSPAGMTITDAERLLREMDRELKAIPEVERVFGKMGSAETATDPAPLNMAETVILLKPRDQWREGMTWQGIVDDIKGRMQWPGMPPIVWMPIQTRTDMLATGVRSPLAVKVFAPTTEAAQAGALAVERALRDDPRTAPHTAGAFSERLGGGLYLDAHVRRDEAGRLGLSVAELNDFLETAVGGEAVAVAVEGRERYPIQVRVARDFRDTPEALARLPVSTPSGAQVPLARVAELRHERGPVMVSTEAGQAVALVYVDAVGLGIPDYVAKAQPVLDEVVLAPGSRAAWAGQYQHWERAHDRLLLVVPATLLIVALLLYLNTRSAVETLIVLAAVPFSLIGAVWLLWLLDYRLSVASWVGMIALAGLDAETAVVMLLYLTLAWRERREAGTLRHRGDLEEAIVDGAARRIRPKLMTVACLLLGLLPVMWADGPGAEVMKRIAAPMVGGVASSFLLELLVYPAVFAWWKGRSLPPRPVVETSAPAT